MKAKPDECAIGLARFNYHISPARFQYPQYLSQVRLLQGVFVGEIAKGKRYPHAIEVFIGEGQIIRFSVYERDIFCDTCAVCFLLRLLQHPDAVVQAGYPGACAGKTCNGNA